MALYLCQISRKSIHVFRHDWRTNKRSYYIFLIFLKIDICGSFSEFYFKMFYKEFFYKNFCIILVHSNYVRPSVCSSIESRIGLKQNDRGRWYFAEIFLLCMVYLVLKMGKIGFQRKRLWNKNPRKFAIL